MLKRTFTYEDFTDQKQKRTEDVYFNISKSELMELELSTAGGITNKINRLSQKLDAPEIMKLFKDIISLAVCEVSPDGRRLVKNKQISEDFIQSPMYDELFMELVTDPDKAAAFIKAVLPEVPTSPMPPATK